MSQQVWQQRYGESGRVWSGRVNPCLEAVARDLPTGAAADIGCGEGADAVWLATQGWQVTALDFAQAALDRGRTAAEAEDASLANRIDWVRQDLACWEPKPNSYDLVSVHFFHADPALRAHVHRAAWRATRGTLLVVGHDSSNATEGHGGPPDPDVLYTAEDVLNTLSGVGSSREMSVEVAERKARHADDPDRIMWDSVLIARRVDPATRPS